MGITLLALLVCGVAITTRSYWIDEAVSVYWAKVHSLSQLWHSLRAEANANLQVPLFFAFAWGWEKLAGSGEMAMRGGNALWFVLGMTVLARALASSRFLCWGMSLATLCSPLAWYYLDEARPYAMQLAASLVVLGSLYRLALCGNEGEEREWLWLAALGLGSLVLAATGLIAMLWLGSYLGAAVLSTSKNSRLRLWRNYAPWLVITLLLLGAIGVYYLWTLTLGARATGGTMDLKTALFIPYELLGFAGLGPARLALRSGSLAVLEPYLPWLGIYAVVLIIVMIQGWHYINMSTSLRTRICWAVAFLCVAAFIYVIGVTVRFRVLGRHCTPLLPVLLAPVGAGIASWLQRDGWIGRAVVFVFIGLSLLSCLELRCSERHAKDDYRSAAALASEALARGETVWWNADKYGALIYHVPLSEQPNQERAADLLLRPPKGFAQTLQKPDMVVTSRPDVYDTNGSVDEFLADAGFHVIARPTAFAIWRASSKH